MGDRCEKSSCTSRHHTATADSGDGEAHLSGWIRYRSVGSLRPLYGEVHRHRGGRGIADMNNPTVRHRAVIIKRIDGSYAIEIQRLGPLDWLNEILTPVARLPQATDFLFSYPTTTTLQWNTQTGHETTQYNRVASKKAVAVAFLLRYSTSKPPVLPVSPQQWLIY